MRYLASLAFIVLCLAGCMSEEQKLVGKWKGTVEVGGAVKNSPIGAQASGLANMTDPQLDLRPDKTFTLYFSFAPIEGTWALQDKDIVLTPKKVLGISADDAKKRAEGAAEKMREKMPFPIPMPMDILPGAKEMRAHVVDDSETITLDPGAGTMLSALGTITFKKV